MALSRFDCDGARPGGGSRFISASQSVSSFRAPDRCRSGVDALERRARLTRSPRLIRRSLSRAGAVPLRDGWVHSNPDTGGQELREPQGTRLSEALRRSRSACDLVRDLSSRSSTIAAFGAVWCLGGHGALESYGAFAHFLRWHLHGVPFRCEVA